MTVNEVTAEKTPKRGIASDKKVLSLLEMAITREMEDADYYARLAGMARSPREKAILRQIRLDELKHEAVLRGIYKKVTGAEPTVTPDHKPSGRRMQAEYEKSVFDELESAEFRKRIYLSFINIEIRDMLLDIFTDEQAHALKLTYLCSNNCRI